MREDFAINVAAALEADCPGNPPEGWSVDDDLWLSRPIRETDEFPVDAAISANMFTEDRRVYCRNAKQAAAIDAGNMV